MIIIARDNLASFVHEIVFFFMSVIFAGTIYVIPQSFLLKYYPDNKNAFLTLLLIAGTIAAIIGVWMSNRPRIHTILNNKKYSITLLLVILTILFDGLFLINNLIVFLLLFIAVKLIANFIFNYLDTKITDSSTEHGLKLHVKAVLLYQLLAYIIAPVYFSLVFFRTPFNIIGVSMVSLLSIIFILKAKQTADASPANNKKATGDNRLDKADWSFLLYSILIQVGIMIISSLIIFILRDYYLYEDAVLKGGILVGYISIISAVTIFATALLRKEYSELKDSKLIFLSTTTNYTATAIFFISAVMLLLKLSHAFLYLLAIGTLTGVSYGMFLHSTRTYANMKASVEHKTGILAHYNNLPNIGTIISLGLVYIFTQISSWFQLNFNKTILVVVLSICLLCTAAVANYSVQYKKIWFE